VVGAGRRYSRDGEAKGVGMQFEARDTGGNATSGPMYGTDVALIPPALCALAQAQTLSQVKSKVKYTYCSRFPWFSVVAAGYDCEAQLSRGR
jgi:hypothetical protein